jgi:GAF domain-containing protein/predicted membrane protein
MTLIERQIVRDPLLSFDELRLRFVQGISILGIAFSLGEAALAYLSGGQVDPLSIVFALLLAVPLFFAFQRFAILLVSQVVIIGLASSIIWEDVPSLMLALVGLSMLSAALFGERLVFYGVLVLGSVRVLVDAEALYSSGQYDFFTGMLLYSGGFILLALLSRILRSRFQEFIGGSRRASELLSASSVIGQVIGQYLDLTPLLNRSVEVIRDRLGFYHVQVFLTDETNDFARLAAATGDIGRVLMAQNKRLAVNSNSLIGRALQAGEALIARETATREDYTFLESLPNTRSELVVPIVDGDRIIGALDVHSMRSAAFNRTDLQALEVMATQLATAIRNARLFEQQEATIRENKRLFLESETNLREIERLNRQLTKQAWDEYLKGRGVVSGVTLTKRDFRPGADWSSLMTQAAQRRRVMTVEDPARSRRVIAVPVELRGEVVGAIEIETSDEAYATDTVDMLQAVSQRLAISLDNARLFEETQEATAQEQRISEIVSGYQTAESIDELLQITLQGLTEALGAERGAIRLGSFADVSPPNGGTHANGRKGDDA